MARMAPIEVQDFPRALSRISSASSSGVKRSFWYRKEVGEEVLEDSSLLPSLSEKGSDSESEENTDATFLLWLVPCCSCVDECVGGENWWIVDVDGIDEDMLEVEPRLETTSEVALWVVARRGEGGDAVEIVACWMRKRIVFLSFLRSVHVEGIGRPEQVARVARTAAPRRCEAANNASGMVEKKIRKMFP